MAEVHDMRPGPNTKDISGQRFGRWTVVRYAGKSDRRKTMWMCRCECGEERIVFSESLRRGTSLSCGCLHREIASGSHRTHGLSRNPVYQVWASMIKRCTNPNSKYYSYYGGRGIIVCERWRKSFSDFFDDMGPRPSPKHSIDRINNDGNYEPENCRWATRREQSLNKRNNRLLECRGQKRTLFEWAEIAGINPMTISCRLKHDWSTEAAIFTPPNPRIQAALRRRRQPSSKQESAP